MNRGKLIQSPSTVRPHVVLLGAGASLDAFPEGDASGYRLPLMHNLVDVVGLEPLIETATVELGKEENFEKNVLEVGGDCKVRRFGERDRK